MFKNFMAVATAAFVFVFFVSSASASVITFEDYEAGETDGVLVENGYKGLNWDNFYAMDGINAKYNPSGYEAAVVSSSNIIYNGYQSDATISSSNSFDLNSAYFTAAWRNALTVSVQGYVNGLVRYTKTFDIDSTGPSFVTFNWANLDSVVFGASGGVDNPMYSGNGTHFAIDNLDISNVPVPAALPLFGFGLAGVSGLKARRRRKGKVSVYA